MSGRVTAVAGVPGNPRIIYVAHASGGLFKSVDGGVTFRSTFDQGGTLSIGALAVSPIAGRPVALFKPMAAVRFVRTPATALAVRADPRWKFTPEEFASHQRAGSTD